jgi:hypothetical protein
MAHPDDAGTAERARILFLDDLRKDFAAKLKRSQVLAARQREETRAVSRDGGDCRDCNLESQQSVGLSRLNRRLCAAVLGGKR